MVVQFGGKVVVFKYCEFGYVEVFFKNYLFLLEGLDDYVGLKKLDVWMSYGDKVVELLLGFDCIVEIVSVFIVVMVNEEKCFYGLQFYLEVMYIRQGGEILKCFVCEICGCDVLWMSGNIIDDMVVWVQE